MKRSGAWTLKMLGDFPENQTIPLLDTLSPLQERLGREQYDLLRMQSMLQFERRVRRGALPEPRQSVPDDSKRLPPHVFRRALRE